MTEILYKTCPRCQQGAVRQTGGEYRCDYCGLTVKSHSRLGLGLFKSGKYQVVSLGAEGDYSLAMAGLADEALTADELKVAVANAYTAGELAEIAGGSIGLIRPVQTILAQIILEQLREESHFQVLGLRRGEGPPLEGPSRYLPEGTVPGAAMDWQDTGNLFGTEQHLVLPSNTFTFIRMDRKVSAVQAFTEGVAVQRRGEAFATYFAGCLPHEAALVAAFVLGKIPLLRKNL